MASVTIFKPAGVHRVDALRYGMMIALFSCVIGAIFLFLTGRLVGHEEAMRLDRARAAGDPGL